MTLNVASFRQVFPEFANATIVPDAAIQFNLDLAYNSLNPTVWGDRLDAAAGFYAAHYVALGLQRAAAVAGGASPGVVGVASGPVASKAVGPVSKTMDVRLGTIEGGGAFNLTTYGQSYLTLLDGAAIGVMQF